MNLKKNEYDEKWSFNLIWKWLTEWLEKEWDVLDPSGLKIIWRNREPDFSNPFFGVDI